MDLQYFEIHELSESKISALVGGKSKKLEKGSAGLYLKSIEAPDLDIDLINARANFEIREKGLLIYMAKSTHRFVFPIPSDDIQKLEMSGGQEQITLKFPSLMGLLLKFGLSIRYARHFSRRRSARYSVEPITLRLETPNIKLVFDSSGYNNYNLAHFIERVKKLSTS